jgi:hypothetical protein
MVGGFVDIEQECDGLFAEPLGGEIDHAATVDEEEEFDFFVSFALFDTLFEFCVGGGGVDLVLDVLIFEEFLRVRGGTDRILRVQRASRSRAVNSTIDTSPMFISFTIFS